ncbi:hypothetical protein LTR84_005978 [Exophiala bonariae]|uniref:Uncharacterized protein n=1 Tax=Exophiala bonariae TaxID=1690606 RepID=A0AAV9N2H2_9EURO|nr:hypothetical protein LTR84_005978 [Exophiala bonariae]
MDQNRQSPTRLPLRSAPAFRDLRNNIRLNELNHRQRTQPVEADRDAGSQTPYSRAAGSRSTFTTSQQSNINSRNESETNVLIQENNDIAAPLNGVQPASIIHEHRSSGGGGPMQHYSRRPIWDDIWLPLACIHGSMLLELCCLAVLISVYKVHGEKGLFSEPQGWRDQAQPSYILLNVPATWLTFVTSRAPQFAGMLAGPLMDLWAWKIAQSMVEASADVEENGLPTVYQFSLLIGIALASFDRLRRWTSYRSCRRQRKRAQRSPKLLNRAGLLLYLWLFLMGLTFAADTLIHYTTATIEFHKVSQSGNIQSQGRGLSQRCLTMDRIENYGWPCSLNNLESEDDYLQEHNEMLFLSHNSSETSEIHFFQSNVSNFAMLLPKTSTLSPYVDFRASTIGVETRCKPITYRCNLTSWGPSDLYSNFSCSPNFWGILGKTINQTDSDLSPLALKVGTNLFVAFFADEEFKTPYNTVGYNTTTGEPDSSAPIWTDDKLQNEVRVTFAARFASTAIRAGTDLSLDAGFYKGPNSVYDIILSCSYQSLQVNYTWFNGTIQDIAFEPVQNGTISEIWHGRHVPHSVTGESSSLQAILAQAAVQPSSTAFAQAWADLYSPVIMATVGGVMAGRANELQQERSPMLVVKLWIPALTSLVFCCLCYIVAGSILVYLALRTASLGDFSDARTRLGIYGIADWAASANMTRQTGMLCKEQKIENEALLVGFAGDATQGYHYVVQAN